MPTLRDIARALDGEVIGNQVSAPGPGHSRKDRSVTVRIAPAASGGVIVHSHCGDDCQTVKDYVLGRLGHRPDDWRDRPRELRIRPHVERADAADRAARVRWARQLWDEASDPRGTAVEVYLAGRALDLDADLSGRAVRFHPRCPFGTSRLPAMVCAMRALDSGQIQAVHRTALTDLGVKVGRKMLGPVAGTAVMLDGLAGMAGALTVGEGIETCLAARVLGYRPAWALGSVGAIRVLPVLPGVEALMILCETDDGGASDAAARVCAERWHQAGRRVTLLRPRGGGDMNDVLRRVRA